MEFVKLAEKRAAEAQAAAAAAGEAAHSDRQGSSKIKQPRTQQQAEQQVRQSVYVCSGLPGLAFWGFVVPCVLCVLHAAHCSVLIFLCAVSCCAMSCCVCRRFCGSLTRAGWPRLKRPRRAAMRPSSRQSTGEDFFSRHVCVDPAVFLCSQLLSLPYPACLHTPTLRDAIKAYSEAAKLDPTNPVYLSNRALCYLRLFRCVGLQQPGPSKQHTGHAFHSTSHRADRGSRGSVQETGSSTAVGGNSLQADTQCITLHDCTC